MINMKWIVILSFFIFIVSILHADAASCPACQELATYPESDMFVSSNDATFEAEVTFFYTNLSETPSRRPIADAPIIVIIKNLTSTEIRKVFTGADGKATFDYREYRDGCQEMTFFYCPFKLGCGFDACMQALHINGTYDDLYSIPDGNGVSFVMPVDFEMPKFLPAAPQSVNYCPPARASLPAFCFPLAIIFALLVGALHLSGKNPLMGFDMSAPRPGRHLRYAARARQTLSLDVASLAVSVGMLVAGKALEGESGGKGTGDLKEGKPGAKTGTPSTTKTTPQSQALADKSAAAKEKAGRPVPMSEALRGVTSGPTIVGLIYGLATGTLSDQFKANSLLGIREAAKIEAAKGGGGTVGQALWTVAKDIGSRSSLGRMINGFSYIYAGTIGRLEVMAAENRIAAYKEGMVLKRDKDGNVLDGIKLEENGKLTVMKDGKEVKEGSAEWRAVADTHIDNLKDAFQTVVSGVGGINSKVKDEKAEFVERAVEAGVVTKSDLEAKLEQLKSERQGAKTDEEKREVDKKIALVNTALTSGSESNLGSLGLTQGDIVDARAALIKDILGEKGVRAEIDSEKVGLQATLTELQKDPDKNKAEIAKIEGQMKTLDDPKNVQARIDANFNRQEYIDKGAMALGADHPNVAQAFAEFSLAEKQQQAAGTGAAALGNMQKAVGIMDDHIDERRDQIDDKKEQLAKKEQEMAGNTYLGRVGGMSEENAALAEQHGGNAEELAKALAARQGVTLKEDETTAQASTRLKGEVEALDGRIKGFERQVNDQSAEVVRLEKQVAGGGEPDKDTARALEAARTRLADTQTQLSSTRDQQIGAMESFTNLHDAQMAAKPLAEVGAVRAEIKTVEQQVAEIYKTQDNLRTAGLATATTLALQYGSASDTLEAARIKTGEKDPSWYDNTPIIGPIAKAFEGEVDIIKARDLDIERSKLEKSTAVAEYLAAAVGSTFMGKDETIDVNDRSKINAAASLLGGQDYHAVTADSLKDKKVDDNQLVMVKAKDQDMPVLVDYGSIKSTAGMYEAIYIDKQSGHDLGLVKKDAPADATFNPLIAPTITSSDNMVQVNKAVAQYFSAQANAAYLQAYEAAASPPGDIYRASAASLKPDALKGVGDDAIVYIRPGDKPENVPTPVPYGLIKDKIKPDFKGEIYFDRETAEKLKIDTSDRNRTDTNPASFEGQLSRFNPNDPADRKLLEHYSSNLNSTDADKNLIKRYEEVYKKFAAGGGLPEDPNDPSHNPIFGRYDPEKLKRAEAADDTLRYLAEQHGKISAYLELARQEKEEESEPPPPPPRRPVKIYKGKKEEKKS